MENIMIDKSPKANKLDLFFAFYRNYGFYKLWLVMFVLSIIVLGAMEVPTLLVQLGSIIISTSLSLLIFLGIIMTTNIPSDDSNNRNKTFSSGYSSSSWSISAPSKQTQRMLKRNIRRRWF